MNLPINSSHENLSLSIKISPNFEKIASGRRPLAIFSKFGLKKLLTTFFIFGSAKTHKIKTSKSDSKENSKRRLFFFRRHFWFIFIDFPASSGTTISKNAPFLPKLCVQVRLMANENLSFMGQVWFLAPSCSLGHLKSAENVSFFFFHHFSSIPPLWNHSHMA